MSDNKGEPHKWTVEECDAKIEQCDDLKDNEERMKCLKEHEDMGCGTYSHLRNNYYSSDNQWIPRELQ